MEKESGSDTINRMGNKVSKRVFATLLWYNITISNVISQNQDIR